jgi:hypothetical protein
MEYGLFEDSDYTCEDLIDGRVGIYPSTILSVYENNTIDIYCGKTHQVKGDSNDKSQNPEIFCGGSVCNEEEEEKKGEEEASTILSVYENNTIDIYCGKTHQVKGDLNDKSQNPEIFCGGSIRDEEEEEKKGEEEEDFSTRTMVTQGQHLVLTTNVQAALHALRLMDPQTLLVDNELKFGTRTVICMTMVSQDHDEAVIFHGPNVHDDQNQIYQLLSSQGVKCVCWDDNCEKDYPNLVDAQRMLYETTGKLKLSLSDYSKLMGTVEKVDYKDYNIYL